jgi:uncharacterized membrane protein YfcA
MSPTQAAGLLVVPSFLTNVAQCRGPSAPSLLKMLWPAWLALAIVTVLLPDLRFETDWIGTNTLLGIVLLAYGAWGLLRPEPTTFLEPTVLRGTLIGALTGFAAAMTAVFVFPLVPYLQTLKLDKETLVQALGLSFTIATVALAVRLELLDEPTPFSAESLLALPAALAGLWLGAMARARISAQVFRRALFLALIGLGAANLLRGA